MKTSDSINIRELLLPSGWKWPLVMMCYYVLFHMTPTISIPMVWLNVSFIINGLSLLFLILGISGYFGWKAKEPIMVESALTAAMYFLFFEAVFEPLKTIPPQWQRGGMIFAVVIWAGMLGYVGAIAGRMFRTWRLRVAGIHD